MAMTIVPTAGTMRCPYLNAVRAPTTTCMLPHLWLRPDPKNMLFFFNNTTTTPTAPAHARVLQ